jgi:hypothetical protein
MVKKLVAILMLGLPLLCGVGVASSSGSTPATRLLREAEVGEGAVAVPVEDEPRNSAVM